MKFEDYIELIKKYHIDQRLDSVKDDSDGFLQFLDALKNLYPKNAKIVESGYKTVAKIEASDLIGACKDLEQPEKYYKILEVLNKKLVAEGETITTVSNDATKMLGLSNRYVLNAQIAKYNRQWSLFAFYMRSLAFFIPQLIANAELDEQAIFISESNAKVTSADNKEINKNIMEWWNELPDEMKEFVCDNESFLRELVDSVDFENLASTRLPSMREPRKTLSKYKMKKKG